jgi:cardiolipin synthase
MLRSKEQILRGVGSLKKHIPNFLSWLRVIILPIIIWLIFCRNFQIIAILLLFGFLTDIADGFLARLWGVQTKFGNILDHVADRIMILPAIYLLIIHMWGWPLIIWLCFEFVAIGLSAYLFITNQIEAKIDNWPNWPGKFSYVIMAIAIMAMLTTLNLSIWAEMHLVINIFLFLSIILRTISLIKYFET